MRGASLLATLIAAFGCALFYYGLHIGIEVLILAFILRSVWTWPRTPAPSMPDLVAPDRSQIQMGHQAKRFDQTSRSGQERP